MSEHVLWILLILLGFPWLVYLSVKLGTYAFFRGRALFHEHEERSNGKKP